MTLSDSQLSSQVRAKSVAAQGFAAILQNDWETREMTTYNEIVENLEFICQKCKQKIETHGLLDAYVNKLKIRGLYTWYCSDTGINCPQNWYLCNSCKNEVIEILNSIFGDSNEDRQLTKMNSKSWKKYAELQVKYEEHKPPKTTAGKVTRRAR